MQFPDSVLQVFCKAPVPGTVKTRLMPELNAVQAAEVHRQLTRQTLDLVGNSGLCAIQLWCAPNTEHPFFEELGENYPIALKAQPEGNLGQRMNFALAEGLQQYQHAILIGCDCPSFTLADMKATLQALASGSQVVLAPTEDGGYSLIGLRQPASELFKSIDWSSPSVLPQTRLKIQLAKLNCFELPIQWDVDSYQDYLRFKEEMMKNHQLNTLI